MRLEIVTGTEKADVTSVFESLVYAYKDENIMKFPEMNILHPNTLYKEMKKVVREHIENDKDLFILTYSDHVLNATRVEIKGHQFEGALCRQVNDDNEEHVATISKNGELSYWENGVFDVWDNALIELLDI